MNASLTRSFVAFTFLVLYPSRLSLHPYHITSHHITSHHITSYHIILWRYNIASYSTLVTRHNTTSLSSQHEFSTSLSSTSNFNFHSSSAPKCPYLSPQLSLMGLRNFMRSVPPVPLPPALPSSFS